MALIYRRTESDSMEITGYEGTVKDLVIPETVEGLTVRRIGKNAFSGREDLRSVHLPQTIDTLGRYAFYNCKNLERLFLYDRVEDYYDGVIKQCGSLSEITLTQTRADFSVMKELLADNDRMLHFKIEPLGLHLTFPAYVYDFVEDVEARVLHHKIEGSGYPCRECVTRKGVDLLAYDGLFDQVVQDDYHGAIDIALERLMYPLELTPHHRENYMQYLEQNAGVVLRELMEKDRLEEISYLCENCMIPEQVLPEILEISARQKKSRITALLMEYQKENFGKKTAVVMTLEDW